MSSKKLKINKKKLQKKLLLNKAVTNIAGCGCTVDVACGVCVLLPKTCIEEFISTDCASIPALAYSNALDCLRELIGNHCVKVLCKAICTAKQQAANDSSADWISFLPHPWKSLLNDEDFRLWYSFILAAEMYCIDEKVKNQSLSDKYRVGAGKARLRFLQWWCDVKHPCKDKCTTDNSCRIPINPKELLNKPTYLQQHEIKNKHRSNYRRQW